MYHELENKTLIGGGIHAEVCVVTTESFLVTGSVMLLGPEVKGERLAMRSIAA